MKTKFVIIGGGLAGLCAAIRLSELGEEPLLLEGGSYPAHKICGEFLSPECLHFLHEWNIHPISISQAVFRTSTRSSIFPFPSAAGGLSHIQLDPALANYASKCGATIRTNRQVTSLQPKQSPNGVHLIQLSNGEILEATHIIVATGRIPNYSIKAPLLSYMGFKAHFNNLNLDPHLEIFSLPGAYLGISPVENDTSNVACIANLQSVKKYSDPHMYMESLISSNPHLKSRLSQGKILFDWMFAPLPAFGIKATPDWLDAYFIGDAAATVPPICGTGLSMGILGGRLAAEYAVRHQVQDFKLMWQKRCSSPIFWGKLLHNIMLHPFCSSSLLNFANHFSSLGKKLFFLTRQS